MTQPVQRPNLRRCPSCGAAVSDAAMSCNTCGGVLAIDTLLMRLRQEGGFLTERLRSIIVEKNLTLWILALIPLLILPPMLAAILSLRPAREGTETERGTAFWIIGIALCNIVLSVLAWRWLSHMSYGVGSLLAPMLPPHGTTVPGAQHI
jgi:hypothetical protein